MCAAFMLNFPAVPTHPVVVGFCDRIKREGDVRSRNGFATLILDHWLEIKNKIFMEHDKTHAIAREGAMQFIDKIIAVLVKKHDEHKDVELKKAANLYCDAITKYFKVLFPSYGDSDVLYGELLDNLLAGKRYSASNKPEEKTRYAKLRYNRRAKTRRARKMSRRGKAG